MPFPATLTLEEFKMAEPIYKIFMGRFLEPWHQLSDEERKGFIAKLDEAYEKAGGQRPIRCDSSWSSDQWSIAGIEEFPNIEAVQNYMAAVTELKLFRYIESTSVLGTKIESK
jgi:hypothetical protein